MLTVRIPQGQDGASAIRELEGLEPGVTAGVNHGYTAQQAPTPAGDTLAREYAADLMQWPERGCDTHLTIGVLDSQLLGPTRLEVTSADFSRSDARERALHGTQIVTLLQSSGMLRSPKIFHADVVSPSDRLGDAASVDTLLRGLNWMASQNVRVVNVSLAGPYNKILDRAFSVAQRRGMVIVAPVGNTGPRSEVRYPAAFRSTISVTAVDAEARVYRKAARGQKIDFSAPGVDVVIQMPGRKLYVWAQALPRPLFLLELPQTLSSQITLHSRLCEPS